MDVTVRYRLSSNKKMGTEGFWTYRNSLIKRMERRETAGSVGQQNLVDCNDVISLKQSRKHCLKMSSFKLKELKILYVFTAFHDHLGTNTFEL